jgi:hypothetical protein
MIGLLLRRAFRNLAELARLEPPNVVKDWFDRTPESGDVNPGRHPSSG